LVRSKRRHATLGSRGYPCPLAVNGSVKDWFIRFIKRRVFCTYVRNFDTLALLLVVSRLHQNDLVVVVVVIEVQIDREFELMQSAKGR
jgi:hypothetical protein